MHKCIIITSSVVGATAGFAMWALLKYFEGPKKLTDKYEDPKIIQKHLMHHYGCSLNMFPLLKDIIAKECENFHQRVADLCKLMCLKNDSPTKRILDVGCATGALSFYLSESFEEVVGIDTSYSMINSCGQLKESSEVVCLFPNEGGCSSSPFIAKLSSKSRKERVKFWDEDACNLVFSCGQFNCVVAANVITHLSEPKQFISKISDYVFEGGLLCIADTYTWENGPEANFNIDGAMSSFECLKTALSPKWKFLEDRNIPYFMANSERSAEVGNCHFTVWKRKSDVQED